jgi:uncharacterized metal-binding protein YceD (DUF177 family)
MRVHLRELTPTKTIVLKGDETWLAGLYGDFPLSNPKTAPLTGSLTLDLEESGSVQVTGTLQFGPTVPCSRCEKTLSWPLAIEVDARYLPPTGEALPRDKTLKASEVESYYLEYQEVDLEALVNDVVQTSLPTRYVQENEDGTACLPCGADLTVDHLWSSESADGPKSSERAPAKAAKDGAPNPFEVLKDLKLRH